MPTTLVSHCSFQTISILSFLKIPSFESHTVRLPHPFIPVMVMLRATSHSSTLRIMVPGSLFLSYLILVIIHADFKIYMCNVSHILSSQYPDHFSSKDLVLHPAKQTSSIPSWTISLSITATPPKFKCKQHTSYIPRVCQQFYNLLKLKIHLLNYLFTICCYLDSQCFFTWLKLHGSS